MNDTPRTDAAICTRIRRKWDDIDCVPADFARALECELAEMTRQRDAAFRMSRCECERDECCANLVRWESDNRRLRTALAEVITAARNSLPRPHPTIERNAALASENSPAHAPEH